MLDSKSSRGVRLFFNVKQKLKSIELISDRTMRVIYMSLLGGYLPANNAIALCLLWCCTYNTRPFHGPKHYLPKRWHYIRCSPFHDRNWCQCRTAPRNSVEREWCNNGCTAVRLSAWLHDDFSTAWIGMSSWDVCSNLFMWHAHTLPTSSCQYNPYLSK